MQRALLRAECGGGWAGLALPGQWRSTAAWSARVAVPCGCSPAAAAAAGASKCDRAGAAHGRNGPHADSVARRPAATMRVSYHQYAVEALHNLGADGNVRALEMDAAAFVHRADQEERAPCARAPRPPETTPEQPTPTVKVAVAAVGRAHVEAGPRAAARSRGGATRAAETDDGLRDVGEPCPRQNSNAAARARSQPRATTERHEEALRAAGQRAHRMAPDPWWRPARLVLND